MDYHADNTPAIRELEREVARLRREQAQFFSRYAALVGHRQNPRMAKTFDTAAYYPTQGVDGENVFPIVFVDANVTDTVGLQTVTYVDHDEEEQANVLSLYGNWIPPETYIEVWQQMGTDASKKLQWITAWKDHIRIGRATTDIAVDEQGLVREWNPDNYDAETDSDRDWTVRTLMGPIEADTWVFFYQHGSVAYAIAKACEPEIAYYQ